MRPHGTLLFAALSIAACTGAESPLAPALDGGAGGTSANSRCGQCPQDSACVVATCVPRAPAFPSPLAMEISPAASTNPQAALTELPSINVADRVFKTTSSLAVAAAFDTPGGTVFPPTANAVLNVPSLIPGRPVLTFETTINPGGAAIAMTVPSTAATAAGMLGLIPLPPADQASPPYWFPFTAQAGATTLSLPSGNQTLFGKLADAFGTPKTGYTARAYMDGALVSNVAALKADGTFGLFVPAAVSGDVSVELAPAGSTDPWFTFNKTPLGEPNKNLGTVALPTYQVPQAVVFMVRGDAGESVDGALLRATTILDPDTSTAPRPGVTRFWQTATTNADGNANLALIPGVNRTPRLYDVAVVPPPGSAYASTCVTQRPILGGGDTTTISVARRPVLSGTVMAPQGTMAGGITVTASRNLLLAKFCSTAGPTSFTTTTNASGLFALPVDADTYQLDFDPPSGSSVPRVSEYNVRVDSDVMRTVTLPQPYLIEGDVVDATGKALEDATIRVFQPVCGNTEPCTRPPILRAETQADKNGHFRAIVALPSGN